MAGKIRATDDEALATELWGDDKKWDEERGQFVPVEKEDEPSAGNSTEPSSDSTPKTGDESGNSPRPTAPTTEPPSNEVREGSSTAHSTAGPGKRRR